MIIGYGYRRKEADLRAAGAEQVWIDTKRDRLERSAMTEGRGLREGDTLLLLHWNDLGGNKPSSDRLAARLEKRGVTVKVADGPYAVSAGRPAKLRPTPEQDAEARSIWLDGFHSLAYKLRRVAEIYGQDVKAHQMYYRHGSPDDPKPVN